MLLLVYFILVTVKMVEMKYWIARKVISFAFYCFYNKKGGDCGIDLSLILDFLRIDDFFYKKRKES